MSQRETASDASTDTHGLEEALEGLRLAEARLARRVHRDSVTSPRDRAALRYVLHRCDHDDPATPSEIAEHLGVSPAAVSAVIERLVQGGAVTTESRLEDRRSKHVRLRDRSELDDGVDPVTDAIRGVLAQFTPEQAEVIRDCLVQLRGAIDRAA